MQIRIFINPHNDLKSLFRLLNTLANIFNCFMHSARIYGCKFRIKSIHICSLVNGKRECVIRNVIDSTVLEIN